MWYETVKKSHDAFSKNVVKSAAVFNVKVRGGGVSLGSSVDGLTYRWPQTSPHPAPGRFHPCRRGRWDILLRTLGSACCRPPLGRIHPEGRGCTGPGWQNWTRRCAPIQPAHANRRKKNYSQKASFPEPFGLDPSLTGFLGFPAAWLRTGLCRNTICFVAKFPSLQRNTAERSWKAGRRAESEAAFRLPVVSHNGGGQHTRE